MLNYSQGQLDITNNKATSVNFYTRSQRVALFLKFILIELYMFRTDLLSIIRSLNTVYTAIGICHASYVRMFHPDITSRQST